MKSKADKAIDVIEYAGKKLGLEYCAYLALPNVILTLSGTRAIADGVFWHDDEAVCAQWIDELNRLMPVLDEVCPLFAWGVRKDANGAAKYVTYDISTTQGLMDLPEQTTFLDSTLDLVVLDEDEVGPKIRKQLRQNSQFKGVSTEVLRHITHGLFLGYPDKAIESMVDYWVNIRGKDKFASKPIEADIRGADYYVCPQPVYQYQRDLVDDADIRAHEQLWSRILHDFYTSDFFKTLEKNPKFIRKIKALTRY